MPLCQQAPLLTFDGTLISDMSFGTLTAQVTVRIQSSDAECRQTNVSGIGSSSPCPDLYELLHVVIFPSGLLAICL